jgi:hypothetical protein
MKPPVNWEEEKNGQCGDLQIHDGWDDRGNPVMISAWKPTPEELDKLRQGKPVMLMIHGRNHPVVAVYVGENADS